jgi:hypothetical protein
MKEQGADLWGTEMQLSKPDAYPIKTFSSFEAPDEDRQFDPISAVLEVLGKVKKGEFVGIQFVVAPADNKWKNHHNKLIEKLREAKTHKTEFVNHEGELQSFERMTILTPGETDVLKAVENNLSKQAFEAILRIVYISPKPIFYDSFARKGVIGAFNQYAALNLNSFTMNQGTGTLAKIWFFPYIFPGRRAEYRKERILFNYRTREMPKETFMGKAITSHFMNPNFASKPFHITTECLATVFHPPTFLVLTAPHLKRSESKKSAPPAGLAIFGEEKEIEGFQ